MPRLKSEKQERFCQLYVKTGNATQSFKDAGYAWNSENAARVAGYRLLNKNPNTRQRIDELRAEVDSRGIADIKEMQELLTKIVREEIDEEVLVVEGDGDGYSHAVKKRRAASIDQRLKAMEKLLKMQGAYIEKIEISNKGPVVISGDDELED